MRLAICILTRGSRTIVNDMTFAIRIRFNVNDFGLSLAQDIIQTRHDICHEDHPRRGLYRRIVTRQGTLLLRILLSVFVPHQEQSETQANWCRDDVLKEYSGTHPIRDS